MPHYKMDPVTERPVPCDRPRKKRMVLVDEETAAALETKAEQHKEQSWPCPEAGCSKIFSSERGMQTHFGRAHKKSHAVQSKEAASRGGSAAQL